MSITASAGERPRLRAAMFNTTSRNGHHGCALVCRQIGTLAADAGIDVVSWFALSRYRGIDWSAYDLILVNGEGSVHHDRPAARKVAEIAHFADRIGKPAYLINSVYEGNGREIGAGVAKFRRVYVRESLSQANLAATGVPSAVVPDLSLSWRPEHAATPGERLVVIDSVSNAVSSELYGLATKLGGDYFSILTRPPALPDIALGNRHRIARHLLRRALGTMRPPGWRREKTVPRHPTLESFVAALSDGTGLVITGRFHGLCLALDLEIPAIALRSNTAKVEGLLADAGLRGRVADNSADVERRVKEGGIAGFRYTDAERADLRAFRSGARRRAEAMFNEIAADAAVRTGVQR